MIQLNKYDFEVGNINSTTARYCKKRNSRVDLKRIYDLIMARKIILVVFVLQFFSNLSECTKLQGLLADKRMNMNVLKMFDRFFHLRHKDAFFIRNFQKHLTDEYLTAYYTKEFEMTQNLRRDISMHAIYLENTVWYTSSVTELFTILYTKYLAANHIISFMNCYSYYTDGEQNEDRATKCKKVAKYLYTFMIIAVKKYISRMENFLYHMEGGRYDNSRPYKSVFDAFTQYFIHITAIMVRENIQEEVPDSNDEFLKNLLLQEKRFELDARLVIKYFFRNVFFGVPMIDYDFLKNKEEEEKIVFNKKNLNNIRNETIKFWEIVDKLVKRIEERDPRLPKLHTRKIEGKEGENLITEKLVKSHAAEIIRKLEIRNLVVRGIEPSHISKLKSGSESEVYQFVVEHFYDGFDVVQKLKFIPLQPENLIQAPTNVFENDYSQMGEILNEEDFSVEAREIISGEKYDSAVLESIAPSATNESYKTDAGSIFASNESFKTTRDSLMSSSRSAFASTETYNNASNRSSSRPVLSESQIRVNRAKVEDIRRSMAERASAQVADKSAKVNYSRPDDVSHLASHMAVDRRGNTSKMINGRNTSSYGDVSQNISQSNMRRDRSTYYDNISKENRFSNTQMISV